MKSIDIMKKVDESIIQNIQKLRVYEQFQDFLETYSNWEEKGQELFKAALLTVVLFIPSFIIFLFLIFNNSNHNHLATKEQILEVASKISSQKSMINQLSRKYLGSTITSQSMLETQIKNALPAINVDANKISFSNFSSQENDGLNKVSADIRFNQLSDQNLFGFLRIISISKKMRIEEIDIKKNKQSNLLEGMITVFHYSKLASLVDE
jgi:hypothetical protein